MMDKTHGDDLEKEIIFMEQELIFKRSLLRECREKLNSEMQEHVQTKSALNKYLNENKELQIQLEVCLAGTQKLEEENKKNRDLLVKLQAEMNAYLMEREHLLDASYNSEKENSALKNEVAELKEQLKGHLVLLENIKLRKSETETLVTEILAKQEILNKEQNHLEAVCKEGLRFAEKLSEEAKFQNKFIQEAKIGQEKMENEMIRLMEKENTAAKVRKLVSSSRVFLGNINEKITALSDFKAGEETKRNGMPQSQNYNYLELWKSYQNEMKLKNEELLEINQRLQEELAFTKDQIELLIKNY